MAAQGMGGPRVTSARMQPFAELGMQFLNYFLFNSYDLDKLYQSKKLKINIS